MNELDFLHQQGDRKYGRPKMPVRPDNERMQHQNAQRDGVHNTAPDTVRVHKNARREETARDDSSPPPVRDPRRDPGYGRDEGLGLNIGERERERDSVQGKRVRGYD